MITSVVQRKRPRWQVLLLIGGAVVAAGLFAATVLATIPPPPADTTCTGTAVGQLPNSIEVADKNHSATCTTPDGAIVDYIGSSANNQSSGTGLFDPFVRLQGTPTEQGFNTDAAVTFDAKTGTWTHSILVSAIPVVTINGVRYWELFNDINETNSTKHISLNKVEIYVAPGPGGANITGYPGFAGFSATEVYAFDGEIRINDVNSGSGRGDLRYLVPLTNIPTPAAGTYFVLYSQWGTTSTTYNSDGGFEEWKVRKAPGVSIVKTADAASVNAGSPIGFTVTVTNTGAADATGVTVSDPLPSGTGVDWSIASQSPAGSCSISGSPPSETLSCGPLTLASGGGQVTVHVTSATTGASCGTYDNTATFTSTNAGTGSSSASVTVNCAAILILKNSSKLVNGSAVRVSNDGAVFSITGPGSYSATVTDNGTGDEDADTGEICVSGLAPGTYAVTETTPPTGYSGTGSGNAVATAGTNCTTSQPTGTDILTLTNSPTYDLQVNFRDGGSGDTSATISCTNVGTADTTPATGWDTSSTFGGETFIGNVVCTITVDP